MYLVHTWMYRVHTGLCRFISVPYYSMVHIGTHLYELSTYNRLGFQMSTSGIRRSSIFGHIPGIFHIYDQEVYMSGIFRHIPGIYQPISYTRYMSRICPTYSFRVVASLCLEYSRYIPHIFFPSHLVICLEYTWIIPLLANRPAAAMQLGCRCCHGTRILGVKGV